MPRLRSLVLVGSAATLPFAPSARAAPPVVVSCGEQLRAYLDAGVPSLTIVGTRHTVGDAGSFASFTMKDTYQLSTPLNTPAAAQQSRFVATRVGRSAYSGGFHEIFPGNAEPRADAWTLWLGRNGSVAVRTLTWGPPGGGVWDALTAVCRRAPTSDQLVILGFRDGGDFGVDYWTFVVSPQKAP